MERYYDYYCDFCDAEFELSYRSINAVKCLDCLRMTAFLDEQVDPTDHEVEYYPELDRDYDEQFYNPEEEYDYDSSISQI